MKDTSQIAEFMSRSDLVDWVDELRVKVAVLERQLERVVTCR